MRIAGFILSAICLGAFAPSQAQEIATLPADRQAAVRWELLPAVRPAAYSIPRLREQTDPTLRQRREIREAQARRAERSVLLRSGQTRLPDPNREVALWRITAGNTAADNWSPYPDRALDARTLRFPLPRNLTPDKRPEHVRRLEKLKR